MLYHFKARKLGTFLLHGRQYKRVGLVFFVTTSSQCFICPWNKVSINSERLQKQSVFFPSSHSLQAMVVKKVYSVQSYAIFWITFVVSYPKAIHKSCILLSLSACACFVSEWNTEMTSQSKLDPFSCIIAIHGPKKCPTSSPRKGTTSEGKIQGQKPPCQSNWGQQRRFITEKKNIGGFNSGTPNKVPFLFQIAV